MKRRDSTERGNAAETSGKCMEMLEKIEVNLENIEGYWKILEACLQTCNLSTKGAEFHHLARAAALTSQPQDATSPYFPSHPRPDQRLGNSACCLGRARLNDSSYSTY